jgi:SAM-dependent methyltransferase
MAFDVAGNAYQRFMGRFSEKLSAPFADFAGVDAGSGMRVVDVGCGPGALTAVLVDRLGASAVTGADPSEPFVAAVRSRLPDVDIRLAPAESLPFADDAFDAALAQLVVHFMTDPVAGLREMGRVTKPGGVVAASVWDFVGGTAPLSVFWRAAQELDPAAPGEADRAGTHAGALVELAGAAGLAGVRSTSLTVHVPFTSYEEWWAPYLDGVGPVGSYVASLDADHRRRVEQRCRELLPEPPFEHAATAWVVLAEAPG